MLIDEKWVSVIQADGLTSASLQEAKKEYNTTNKRCTWSDDYAQAKHLVLQLPTNASQNQKNHFFHRFFGKFKNKD